MDERFFIVIQHPFEDSHRQSIEPFLSGLSSQKNSGLLSLYTQIIVRKPNTTA